MNASTVYYKSNLKKFIIAFNIEWHLTIPHGLLSSFRFEVLVLKTCILYSAILFQFFTNICLNQSSAFHFFSTDTSNWWAVLNSSNLPPGIQSLTRSFIVGHENHKISLVYSFYLILLHSDSVTPSWSSTIAIDWRRLVCS